MLKKSKYADYIKEKKLKKKLWNMVRKMKNGETVRCGEMSKYIGQVEKCSKVVKSWKIINGDPKKCGKV